MQMRREVVHFISIIWSLWEKFAIHLGIWIRMALDYEMSDLCWQIWSIFYVKIEFGIRKNELFKIMCGMILDKKNHSLLTEYCKDFLAFWCQSAWSLRYPELYILVVEPNLKKQYLV